MTAAIVACALLASLALWYIYRQEISDLISASRFDAPASITSISDDLALSSTGERIFLATHPTLDSSQKFNERCQSVSHTEDGHVLGCYADDSIHLYEVTDARISGVVTVTAAHELLHAAWARMSDAEKDDLSPKLRDAYDELAANDPALQERMSVYESLGEREFVNELHSVLGTEQRELPDWLEEHYRQWFTDRASIIATFDDYHSLFVDMQERADELSASLEEIRDEVERRNDDYADEVERYNDNVADFNARNDRKEFADDPAQFDALRDELETRKDGLDTELAAIQARIDEYEQLRSELKELSQQSTELDQNLNSDLAPPEEEPSG